MTTFLRRRVDAVSGMGWVAVVAAVAAALIGGLAAASPLAALAGAAAVGAIWLLSLGKRMIPLFHVALLTILLGYAFLGRGGAYIGVAPIYVGEVVLALGVISILVSLPGVHWRPIHLAVAVFMLWGLFRTVPYVSLYGIDALRDGVTWAYAIFAIAVSLTVRREHVEPLLRLYRRWLPWFVLWVPVAAILSVVFSGALPSVPGSSEPIIDFKAGDAAVHLSAAGAFMVLGLGTTGLTRARDWLWPFWLLAVGVCSAISRGALAAAAMMATSVLFARATTRWLSLILIGVFLFAVLGLVNPEVDVGLARRLSFDQVVSNLTSVLGGEQNDPVLEGTKEWRLRWWTTIVDYTVDGPYFWTGKGFGVNLADDDGFQVGDLTLRSPHSAHLTFLARGGVPMLALWILVQAAFAFALVRAALRARAAGMAFWVRVCGWIFVFWLAALVNASFDVYLEGPMGGIWFWSMVGLGIAVAGIIDRELEAPVSTGAVAPPVLS
jgi:O-Antigen ligase